MTSDRTHEAGGEAAHEATSVIERGFAPEGALPVAEPAPGFEDRPTPENQQAEEPEMASKYEFGADAAQSTIDQAQGAFAKNANQAQDAFTKNAEQAQGAFAKNAEQAQAGLQQATDTMRGHSEDAMRQGQAAMGQMADRSREAMDKGMKAFDEFNAQARGQVDAWTQASRAAAQGVEAMVQQAAEFSRKTFEDGTAAMRTLASARTPTDVFQAQNDFTKKQFDNFVGQFSRLTETMMRVTNEVMEPVASKMTESAQKAGDAVKQGMTGLTSMSGGQRYAFPNSWRTGGPGGRPPGPSAFGASPALAL